MANKTDENYFILLLKAWLTSGRQRRGRSIAASIHNNTTSIYKPWNPPYIHFQSKLPSIYTKALTDGYNSNPKFLLTSQVQLNTSTLALREPTSTIQPPRHPVRNIINIAGRRYPTIIQIPGVDCAGIIASRCLIDVSVLVDALRIVSILTLDSFEGSNLKVKERQRSEHIPVPTPTHW